MQKDCLITDRLILRKFTMDDAEEMFSNWANDPEVCKYMTWTPHQSIDTVKMILDDWMVDYDDEKTVRYGITLKETGELFGSIDVVGMHDGVPEIGYCSSKRFWGHGYMTEACKALTDYLFELGYNEIVIEADERNIGSLRVIEKVGFTYTHSETKQCSKMKPEIITVKWFKLSQH